jgi:hypothetical protein
MEWFKFYHNKWLTDRAINNLRPQDRLCFITLLCVTSQSDERNGIVTNYCEHEIIKLTQLDINVYDDEKSDYHLAIGFTERLVDCGVIEIINDKQILIKSFTKRQDTMLSPAERSKKYRDKKRVTNVTNKSDERTARVEKIREDKIREEKIDTTAPLKLKFGEFYKVNLTQEEFNKLNQDLGEQPTTTLIVELDQYIAGKGKDPYKDHYAVIKTWYRKKLQDHASKFIPGKPKMI